MLVLTDSPTQETRSADYTVTLNGKPAVPVQVRVSAVPYNRVWPGHQRPLDQTETAAYLSFAADEPVEVCITPARAFSEVAVRPLNAGIVPDISNGTIRFTITAPGQYTVEPDGPHHALHLFADAPEAQPILPDMPDVLYFGPGVHCPGELRLESNTTVYLHRDAVVYGSFYAVGAQNIRICGSGVLDGGWWERGDENFLLVYDHLRFFVQVGENAVFPDHLRGSEALFNENAKAYIPGSGTRIYRDPEQFEQLRSLMKPVPTGLHFYACRNVTVEGIILRDSAGLTCTQAGCEDIRYLGAKLIGMWRYNSDGIDFYNCRRCLVRGCFIRSFDDCICMKGAVGWDTEITSDITVENCVLWNDWGHVLEFGADSVTWEISRIIFRSCDCIHHTSNVMSLFNMDRAHIRDVLFEDIRVEYSKYDVAPVFQTDDTAPFVPTVYSSPLIFGFVELCRQWSNDYIPGRITDVVFRNIQVFLDEGHPFPVIELRGWDEEHNIDRLRLEGIFCNGRRITSPDELYLKIGSHARIEFDL